MTNPNSVLLVAVDGGGTGCRLAAYSHQGQVLASSSDGPASLTLGPEQAWVHIRRGIQALAQQLQLDESWMPETLCMGLAGSLRDSSRQQFFSLLPESVNATLVTDGHAQLLGASGGEPAVCLAVGTGSVMHWLGADGSSGMAGGWGFPVGDEASGAWLGFQLINRYLWQRDAGQPLGAAVFKLLEARMGTTVSDIQQWSTQNRSTEFASLVPLIIEAAKQDDAEALSLLDDGAVQCARLLSLAPSSLPIYLVGGLAPFYQERLHHRHNILVHTAKGNALDGLLRLAQLGKQRIVIKTVV